MRIETLSDALEGVSLEIALGERWAEGAGQPVAGGGEAPEGSAQPQAEGGAQPQAAGGKAIGART